MKDQRKVSKTTEAKRLGSSCLSLFQPQLLRIRSTFEELFCASLTCWNERLHLCGQDRRATTEALQQNGLIETMQLFQWNNTIQAFREHEARL